MPFQFVILRGRSEVKVHRLGPGVTVAGRQEGCHLQVKASLVSRKHCEFFEQDDVLYVKDLNSSNGTFVNNEKVEGQRALQPGDEVSIGGVKFRLERIDAPRPQESAPPVAISAPDSDAAIPFDQDDETVLLAPGSKPAARTPAAAAVQAVAPAKAEAEAEPETETETASSGPELGEDAVADFLLDLDIDDDDKS